MAIGIQIRVLGELEVRLSGTPAPRLGSKKTRALLAYLAITGRPHTRGELCDLLWEGPDDPRASLRWSLCQLRPLVDDGRTRRLVADRERVELVAATIELDLVTVEKASLGDSSTAGLEALARAFAGELLEGLDLPGCHRFQGWLDETRDRARRLRAGVLRSLVERLAGQDIAVTYARRLVALDPLVEESQAILLHALAACGRRREALDHYPEVCALLRAELGASPSEILVRARAELDRVPDPAPAAPAAPRGVPIPEVPTAPLVGRLEELATIRAALDGVFAGEAQPVLVFSGDPGIGKSRLAEEVARGADRRGGRALVARAFEVEMIRPYAPWIDLLAAVPDGAVPRALRPDLAPLLPSSGRARPGVEPARLYEAVARLLAHLAQERPVVIVLDDLHWADEGSLGLLHFCARSPSCARVFFAGTARSGELADNAAAQRLLRTLARESRIRLIEVEPLGEADTTALVESVGAGLDAARIFRESEGNPLFAQELVRAMRSGVATGERSLDELLEERLAFLDEGARRLVPWLAALGRRFSAELLERVAPLPPRELVALLEVLERRRILRAVSGGYDFSHDLVRRAAYRHLSPARRRLVHLHIARALEPLADADDALAGDLHYHAEIAGELALAARAARRAGERCLRLFQNVAAAELADRGLRTVDAEPPASRARLRFALLRLEVLSRSAGRLGARPGVVDRLHAAIADLVQERRFAEVAMGHYLLSVHFADSGETTLAREHTLLASEAARVADGRSATRHLANTARCMVWLEIDIDRARAFESEAEEAARSVGIEDTEIYWCRALLSRWEGDFAAAAALLEKAVVLARAEDDRWREVSCLATLASVALERGQPESALRWCDELAALAARAGEGNKATFGDALRALAQQALGEETAARDVDVAMAALRLTDSKAELAFVANEAARLALEGARLHDAEHHANEALAAAAIVRRHSMVAIAHAQLAEASGRRGDLGAAARHLQAAQEPVRVDARARAATRRALEQLARAH